MPRIADMLSRIHFFMLDPLSSEEFKHSCIGQSFERDIESGAVKYFPVSKKDQCLVVGSHTRPPARKPHANLERGIRVKRESERDDSGQDPFLWREISSAYGQWPWRLFL